MEKSFAKRVQIELIAVIHATWGRTVSDGYGNLFRSFKQFKTVCGAISLWNFSCENLSTLRKSEAFSAVFIKLENCNFQFKIEKRMEIVWLNILWKAALLQFLSLATLEVAQFCCFRKKIVLLIWRRYDEKKISHHEENRWKFSFDSEWRFFEGVEEFQKRKSKLFNNSCFNATKIFFILRWKLKIIEKKFNLLKSYFSLAQNSWMTFYAYFLWDIIIYQQSLNNFENFPSNC